MTSAEPPRTWNGESNDSSQRTDRAKRSVAVFVSTDRAECRKAHGTDRRGHGEWQMTVIQFGNNGLRGTPAGRGSSLSHCTFEDRKDTRLLIQ